MSKKILSAAMLTAITVQVKEVEVAKDQAVYIREMTAGEREDYEKTFKVKDSNQIRATLVSRSVCDEKGELLFTDEDIPALMNMPASIALKIYAASNELNGLTVEAVDKAEQD